MIKLSKRVLMLISFFAITAVLAESGYESTTSNCDASVPVKVASCVEAPTISGYSAPARINVANCWDFFITGTFLWWEPRQEQMSFAVTSFINSGNGSTDIGKIHDFDFDWKPAFKVGLGSNFEYDDWTAYVQYTRVNTDMSSSASKGANPIENLDDLWLSQDIPSDDTSFITAKWDLNFNIFDLEFARAYYSGKKLTFTPHFGIKGGWIDQKLRVHEQNSTKTQEVTGTFTTDSWLIGPRVGLNSFWMMGEGFRFFGNAAGSLFYQKFYTVKGREPLRTNTALWHNAYNLTKQTITPCAEMALGICWGDYFDCNKWYIDLSVGYEAQVFFNQNMMRVLQQFMLSGETDVFSDPGSVPNVKAGNLIFHGLTATLRIDF